MKKYTRHQQLFLNKYMIIYSTSSSSYSSVSLDSSEDDDSSVLSVANGSLFLSCPTSGLRKRFKTSWDSLKVAFLGNGLKLVINGSDEANSAWIKSSFVDVLETFLVCFSL